MTFNRRLIKKHKGRIITLVYKNKRGYQDEVTGKIVGEGYTMFLFDINNEHNEIPIRYERVIGIKQPEK